MAYFTYDTSVCISRKLTDFTKMPHSFRLSAVAMMELIAGARDDSFRKFYEGTFAQYEKTNLLIIPNGDDWVLASKILYFLLMRGDAHIKGSYGAYRQGPHNAWLLMFSLQSALGGGRQHL